MERARAEPSLGSVPAPSSSKSTNICSGRCSSRLTNSSAIFPRISGVRRLRSPSILCRISMIRLIWDEKVLKFCSMLCSSPISAKISWNTAISESSSVGICKPDWAISDNKPTVLSATVLPPVLGPVITTIKKSCPRWKLIGTTLSVNKGWRALRRLIRPSSFKCGSLQRVKRA